MNVLIFIIIIIINCFSYQISFAEESKNKREEKNMKNDIENMTNSKNFSKYPKTSVLADIFRKKIQNLKTHKEVKIEKLFFFVEKGC